MRNLIFFIIFMETLQELSVSEQEYSECLF